MMPNSKEKAEKLKQLLRPNYPFIQKAKKPLLIFSWICHGMIWAVGSVVLIGDWLGLAS